MNPNAAALALLADLSADVAARLGTDVIGNVHNSAGNALIEATNAAHYVRERGILRRETITLDAETAKVHFVAHVGTVCAYTYGVKVLSERTRAVLAAAYAIAF